MKTHILFALFLIITISTFSFAGENQYYFVFLNSNPDRDSLSEDKVMELQEGHRDNISRLAKEGKLLIAGPVKGGGGIFVLNAPSLEEANEFLQTDPAVKANRFKLEVFPMKITSGNICSVPEENFQMVNYVLIRYENDFFVKDNAKLLVQIDFEDRNDGIAVLNYDLEKGEEGILNNLFSTDKIIYTKTLWIGKGSFCE